jgi:cytochrome c-type biogenesis protein CcmH
MQFAPAHAGASFLRCGGGTRRAILLDYAPATFDIEGNRTQPGLPMLLWIIFAALTAAVALVIVRPFWRPREASSGFAHDIAVYKQQLAEIEDERSRGLLGEAEAEAGRIEISRRILLASENAGAANTASGQSQWAPYLLISVLATTAMGAYLFYGSPQLRDQPLSARVSPHNQQSVDALIAKVEERLRSNPRDGAGWGVIAPVYMRLGRYPEAADAFKKAIELLGETPERLGDLGEALTFASDGTVSAEARAAFEKVLAKQPEDARAGFWIAVSQEQVGKLDEAAARYKKLIDAGLPENVESVVKQRLAGVEARQKGAPAADADQAAMIDGMVSGLAERLQKDGSDLEGWLKLVRAYTVLGRREDAIGALKQAQSQFTGNVEALGRIEQLAKSLGLTS